MKKIQLSILFSLAVLTATSQKIYFIYIQAEPQQPFFVKINKKILNSTASGYIILPKLVDSTYSFNIGFPQSKGMEQQFSVKVGKQDHGYLLKNFDTKGWGLFDLQTMAVQMSLAGNSGIAVNGSKDESSFTDILSKAADDPSLKEKPVQPKVEEKKPVAVVPELVKKEEPKVEEKKPVVVVPELVKKDEPKVEEKKPVVKEEQVEPKKESIEHKDEPYIRSQVKKWSESSTTEGFGLVFIDIYENGVIDTIRLLIPTPKPVINVVKEEPKEEKKFLEITPETTKKENPPVVKEEKTTEVKPIVTTLPVEKAVVKNNCKEIAVESDFFKLRKILAGEESEDNMTTAAKKYFKTKCFSTAQIKNLGTLFLTEEGKYNFFDAAYKFVSDPAIFVSLQEELKDPYYNSRFKAMLRN